MGLFSSKTPLQVNITTFEMIKYSRQQLIALAFLFLVAIEKKIEKKLKKKTTSGMTALSIQPNKVRHSIVT